MTSSPSRNQVQLAPQILPKKWLKKCEQENFNGPLSKQFIPTESELDPTGSYDPIGDLEHQMIDGLIHRYQNRVLFLPTKACPVACRYCFRKHEMSKEENLFAPNLPAITSYLQKNKNIQEIIFSGGDPFSLPDYKIQNYLDEFSKIPHIKWIRFHTRYPSVMPQRFQKKTFNMLEKAKQSFSKISIALHINHWSEWDEEVAQTLQSLANSGCQLLSQTVLLKGVNNDVKVLTELFSNLSTNHIRPYYLHHPDLPQGGQHFYISLDEGRKLFHQLRDKLPGWCLPQYIIDIPGGHGKIPATNAENQLFQGQLVDRAGKIHHYPYS